MHAAGSAGVRPQERVLRHTVEQFGYVAPGLPALHVPVPQTVGKLEDVLKIVDLFLPVQEIDVPKISSLSRPPPRRVLPVPHTAEQLVDVPSPAWMRLALGCDAAGRCVDLRVAAVHGVYWSVEGTRHTQMTPPPSRQGSPPAQGGIFLLGNAEAAAPLDVPVTMQLKFQQSFVEFFKVPQLQFIDRVVVISVAPQRQVSQCKLCR